MRESGSGTARQEAERLVVTAVAAAQVAAGGAAARIGHPEQCACGVCRTLAAVRDPDPTVVERLASRAGDAAAGAASLMRSASAVWRGAGEPPPADEVWRAATRDRHTGRPGQPADDVWAVATRPAAGLAVDRPAVDRPVVDEPTAEDPAVHEPTADQPAVDEPGADSPGRAGDPA